MAIYSLSQRTIITTAGQATWEMRTAASDRCRILEVGISQVTGVAGVYGLGRPGALGLSPTSPQTFLAEDPADATGTVTSVVAWASTVPTVPVNFFRRVICPATIGAGVIWTFPRGLILGATSGLVLWIIATAPVVDIWCVIDE